MRDPAASLNTRLAVGSFFAYLIVAPQSSSTSVVRSGTNPSAAPERFKLLVISTSLDNRPHKCYYSPCKYYLEEPYAA